MARMMEISTVLVNVAVSNFTTTAWLAPNIFLIPISLLLRSAVKVVLGYMLAKLLKPALW